MHNEYPTFPEQIDPVSFSARFLARLSLILSAPLNGCPLGELKNIGEANKNNPPASEKQVKLRETQCVS